MDDRWRLCWQVDWQLYKNVGIVWPKVQVSLSIRLVVLLPLICENGTFLFSLIVFAIQVVFSQGEDGENVVDEPRKKQLREQEDMPLVVWLRL